MRVSREKKAQAMPGAEFKTLRLRLGLTQSQMASVMGLSTPSVVGDMERAKKRVPDYLARHALLLVCLREWEEVAREAEENGWRGSRDRVLDLLASSPLPPRAR